MSMWYQQLLTKNDSLVITLIAGLIRFEFAQHNGLSNLSGSDMLNDHKTINYVPVSVDNTRDCEAQHLFNTKRIDKILFR